jgi:hypothetical protein
MKQFSSSLDRHVQSCRNAYGPGVVNTSLAQRLRQLEENRCKLKQPIVEQELDIPCIKAIPSNDVWYTA